MKRIAERIAHIRNPTKIRQLTPLRLDSVTAIKLIGSGRCVATAAAHACPLTEADCRDAAAGWILVDLLTRPIVSVDARCV